MTVPKDRTVAALTEVWVSLAELGQALSDEQWRAPSPLPGWSVQDNFSHIIGTEMMLAGRPQPEIEIDRAANPHVKNDIGAFNEAWVAHLRASSPTEVLALFEEITASRLEALREITDEAWNEVGFTPAGQDTHGRFMQIRVFDCWLHEQDVRDAVGVPGHLTGIAVDVALDEMSTALGFVVGKRAGIGSGNSVTFALTHDGVVVRELHVEVAERAAVVSALAEPATATLTMPVGVMTRLGAGRVTADALRDHVEITGDTAVGERVLANMAYTI